METTTENYNEFNRKFKKLLITLTRKNGTCEIKKINIPENTELFIENETKRCFSKGYIKIIFETLYKGKKLEDKLTVENKQTKNESEN